MEEQRSCREMKTSKNRNKINNILSEIMDDIAPMKKGLDVLKSNIHGTKKSSWRLKIQEER